MSDRQSKADDKLVDTGKPDDPAKREQDNLDTREDQQKPYRKPDEQGARQDDDDPALETTRKAGQGSS